MNNVWILAKAEDNETSLGGVDSEHLNEGAEMEGSTKIPSDPNAAANEVQQRGPLGKYGNLFLLGLMFVVMYVLLFRGPRKKQQQHRQMVQSLKKNDRVQTIGGIIGTIVDIKDNEITLKVDESNNTKIKVVFTAIGKNLSKD